MGPWAYYMRQYAERGPSQTVRWTVHSPQISCFPTSSDYFFFFVLPALPSLQHFDNQTAIGEEGGLFLLSHPRDSCHLRRPTPSPAKGLYEGMEDARDEAV